MAGSRNSKTIRSSKRPAAAAARPGGAVAVALVLLVLSLWSAGAVWFFHSHGWLLYYGDAEAHLNIARRIVDSRTPGYDQLGTVWLPLPHAIMLPFVRDAALWQSGLAAAIPMGCCFVLGGAFLFAAVRRLFDSTAAALAATALVALNPNLMYLQSLAMTEAVFFAALMALLYATVRFRESQGWGAVVGAAVAACAAALTRYEGWFLLPFVALYFLLAARQRRLATAAVFCLLAGLGPLWWLFHNWWLAGDPLEFYRGPYSAMAIQGNRVYPGHRDWNAAFYYYRTAVEFCSGQALLWMALAGTVVALVRRAWWAVALLLLPGVFYVWSLHSSGTPIFVPTLWPHSYYNTRYGLALLPLLAVAAAALTMVAPARFRGILATLVVVAGSMQWALYPHPDYWVTWKESKVNSEARREWTRQVAERLAPRYRAGEGIFTSFSDITGIYRTAGIPLRETFTGDNGLPWLATTRRPELFPLPQWAVVVAGDAVQTAVWKAPRWGIHYRLVDSVVVKGAQVIEIYKR
jgi:hypothetical protein